MSLGEALLDLQRLTERLRRDCPWDREQTAATIVPHTVEEAYEVADAALAGADEKLLDELGDLLFQVYFLALLLAERGAWRPRGRWRATCTRSSSNGTRTSSATSRPRPPGDVRENWETIKREQEGREGVFHHVPENLPALLLARKVQRRAAAVGFEYPDAAGALADLEDELRELHAELREEPAPELPPDPRQAAELGDVLFAAVNVARRLNVDPELELRRASKRFVERVEEAERLAAADGSAWSELALDEQDRYFDRAKEAE